MTSSMGENEHFGSCEFQENLEILRQIVFFSGLPLERLKVFAFICEREHFKPGDHLFRQGEDDGQAFYIISGSVALHRHDGVEDHMVREYGVGDFIGGMSLLTEQNRLFSLKATTPVTCMVVPREKFKSTLQQFTDILPKLVKVSINNVFSWEDRFLNSVSDHCEICREKLGVSIL